MLFFNFREFKLNVNIILNVITLLFFKIKDEMLENIFNYTTNKLTAELRINEN